MAQSFKKHRYVFGSLLVAALIVGGVVIRTNEDEFVAVIVKNVVVRVEVVASQAERARGLSGRGALPQSGGMFFLFDESGLHSIWMKDMKFPIDILWLSEDMIVDIEERVSPPAPGPPLTSLPVYTPDAPARFVLEVNAGFVERHGIRIGDLVKIPWFYLGLPEGPLPYDKVSSP